MCRLQAGRQVLIGRVRLQVDRERHDEDRDLPTISGVSPHGLERGRIDEGGTVHKGTNGIETQFSLVTLDRR
jgi:hypothetical protein